MKIYYTGAHSVGKSTLARYTSKQYNLPMLGEAARKVLSDRELNIDALRSDIDIVNSYQLDIFNRQLIEEQKHKSFISDRSLLDCIAYSSQHTTIVSELFSNKELHSYIQSLKSKNVIIFFIRPSKATLKDDGIREQLNWDGVIAIDAMIKLLLEMYSIRYFTINTDSMQERIRIVNNTISLISPT